MQGTSRLLTSGNLALSLQLRARPCTHLPVAPACAMGSLRPEKCTYASGLGRRRRASGAASADMHAARGGVLGLCGPEAACRCDDKCIGR